MQYVIPCDDACVIRPWGLDGRRDEPSHGTFSILPPPDPLVAKVSRIIRLSRFCLSGRALGSDERERVGVRMSLY